MDELIEKNFKALAQALKDERVKSSEMQIEVSSLIGTISGLSQQVIQLQQQYGIMMARIQGTGATA